MPRRQRTHHHQGHRHTQLSTSACVTMPVILSLARQHFRPLSIGPRKLPVRGRRGWHACVLTLGMSLQKCAPLPVLRLFMQGKGECCPAKTAHAVRVAHTRHNGKMWREATTFLYHHRLPSLMHTKRHE